MAILDGRDRWEAGYRDGFLVQWEQTGKLDWRAYPRPANEPPPPSAGVDLGVSRLMLISTAGGYLPESQEPFDAANLLGDYTIRTFPSDTPFDALAYAHEHYDHAPRKTDPGVLLPLPSLAALDAAEFIGSIAPSVVSFMGYQPDLARVVDDMISDILHAANAQDVQAALLVPA